MHNDPTSRKTSSAFLPVMPAVAKARVSSESALHSTTRSESRLIFSLRPSVVSAVTG